MTRLTRNQIKARAVRQAKAHRRLCIARDCSGEGLTKAEAAKRAGMTLAGLNTMLFRELGSSAWPIGGEA